MVTRVALNDFAGHAFMLDLAAAFDRSGLAVAYQYCDTNLSPHGDFDNSELAVDAISTRRPFEKYNVARRIVCELEYGWKSARALNKRRADLSILNNVPLLSLAFPLIAGKLRRAQRVIWLQDVQSGLVAGVQGGENAAYKVARFVEGFLLRRADAVIAISDELAQSAISFGVKPDRVTVIENWAPIDEIPATDRENPWSTELGLSERPRFVYSGTLARKHRPDLLLQLAQQLPDVDVLVISEGVGAEWLAEQNSELSLPNLVLLPFQPFERVPQVLGAADVLVAVLTDDAAGHSVPSKVLSYLCAGRAVLASIPKGNAAARMISERAGAGLTIDPSDDDGFISAAKRLAADTELRTSMGKAGRMFAETTFSSDDVAARVVALLSR